MIRARHQGSVFDSDVVEAERGLPVELSIVAHVKVTRLLPEYYYPPLPGNPVRVVSGAEYAQALFMDKMERKFPLGLSLSGREVVYGNLDFLTGRKGAHVNISGISGVATKTTYTTFLMHSLLCCDALPDPANTHAIIFNVKGEDLLFLDKKNKDLMAEDEAQYAQLGLPAEPFDSVQFFVPPAANRQGPLIPKVAARRPDEVTPYFWTVRSFCREGLLRYLFTEVGEDASLLSTLVYQVESRLKEAADEAEKRGPGPGVFLRTAKKGKDDPEEDPEVGAEQEIRDFLSRAKAVEVIVRSRKRSNGAVNVCMRRLYGAQEKVAYLIRDPGDADPARHTINWRNKQVTVVSITDLYEVGKSFVVGSVLQQIQEEKEATGAAGPLCF